MSRYHASSSSNETRADVYKRVTDQIVKAIVMGTSAYEMPWNTIGASSGLPKNAVTGKYYRGVNVVALWAAAHAEGYPESTWATFKQWGELGHKIRRGEKAAIGVFWKPLDAPDTVEAADDNADADDRRFVARAFTVFNAAQVEGYEPPALPARADHERITHADAFIAALGADIRHGGNRAFYNSSSDYIQMPQFEAFVDPVAYYSVLAHEATHWTGHCSRLNRDLKNRFGSESYAAEELIAELGAAFIAADLGLAPEPKPENAAYIDSWLKILKADTRAIFTAASQAQHSADYLHRLQSNPAPLPAVQAAEVGASPQLAFAL